VTVWGTGAPRREFLHVDDLPMPFVSFTSLRRRAHRHIGWGEDVTIRELAELVMAASGYKAA